MFVSPKLRVKPDIVHPVDLDPRQPCADRHILIVIQLPQMTGVGDVLDQIRTQDVATPQGIGEVIVAKVVRGFLVFGTWGSGGKFTVLV